jgi:serine/threonine-protein kinase
MPEQRSAMDERYELKGNQVVFDRQTGLVWHRDASGDRMVWKDGFAYIEGLNQSRFGGHDDWRYPSKDELVSLILPEEDRLSGLFVDPVFGKQRNCWTSTSAGHHRAIYVDFYYGDAYIIEENYANHFVRAVRAQQA